MSRLSSASLALLTLCTLSFTAQAEGRGPSTSEERARIVRLNTESDRDPLKIFVSDGRWFAKWLDEVPDVQFGPEAPARWMEANAKGDLLRVAVFKYQLGGVAYMLKHELTDPRKDHEQLIAIHTAALEGVVRAYSALKDAKPENRSAQMDQALEKLNKGEFPAFVRSLFGSKP